MEQTRIIRIEVTVIDDANTYGPAEDVVAFWKSKFEGNDDVKVTVQDFLIDKEDVENNKRIRSHRKQEA